MTIPRDLGSPFDPTDPIELAEFWGFGPDVPNTSGMAAAVADAGGVVVTHTALLTAATAQSVRAAKLFSEGFLRTVVPGVPAADFPTPDEVLPAQVTARFMRSGRAQTVDIFPPGNVEQGVKVWSFEGLDGGFVTTDPETEPADNMWPAPTMRVVEGDVVHVQMRSSHGAHTIHHHGIEPTPVNDGVGHLTMEVDGSTYKYQWKAGEAGTYFYHCHRNTVLHFELGMYGLLIVDTPSPEVGIGSLVAPYASFGPGYTLLANLPTRYDKETFWVVDDIDTRWHAVGEARRSSGIPGPALDVNDDPVFSLAVDNDSLNDFHPDFFVVTGVTVGDGTNGSFDGILEPPGPVDGFRTKDNPMYGPLYNAIQPSINRNENLLIRTTNASYCTTVWRFPAGLDGTVVAIDGRTLGRPGFGNYSYPFRISSLPLDHSGHRTFSLSTAQRWDILINTDVNGVSLNIAAGTYDVLVEFRHWNDDYDILQRADASTLQTVILPVTVVNP